MSMENSNVFSNRLYSDSSAITFLDLPVEVFLHICSFLDTKTLLHGLSCTCKQFYEILNDDSLWKVRIGQIWQNVRYPVFPPDEEDDSFWKQSCVRIENHVSFWKNKQGVREISLAEGHFTTVDTLMLIEKGQYLISGGRDRTLCCWDLCSGWNTNTQYETNQMSHDGWIWDLTAVDKTFYSCSWDKSVKSWHINNLHLMPIRKFEMDVAGALLCITSYPGVNLLATGSQCRSVILFDPRVGTESAFRYRSHKGAVLKVAMNENYVLSASEDKTVSVWDQRAAKTLTTIEIAKDAFPMSMAMDKRAVYVGDNSGRLHILDSRNRFEMVKSYDTGHTKGINCLCATPGGLITGSLDKTVRFLSPTDPPQLITRLSGSVGEIAGMDYQNGVLAICGSYIQVWRPRID
ncbi:F-box/WD repeat-containing protein 9-like [Venturia canescens]|uniref:F-box/WD repeat-containing protein 9-like n=1 Tax=Venturia canescens TaxID=32260 RepID=UPI001C9C58E7|nr:F-box/WD repeat-containing protein 9-like [Venturia canescens]